MAAYAPERLDTRYRSSSDERRSPNTMLRERDDGPTHERTRRSRSKRHTATRQKPVFYGNGTYRTFEDHEQWNAEYIQANALAPRAKSADTRPPSYQEHRDGRFLTPEKPARFDQRSSSDPQSPHPEALAKKLTHLNVGFEHNRSPSQQKPRFEEMPDDLEAPQADQGALSSNSSDIEDYEAPGTLLGQAQDCLQELAKAANRARVLTGLDDPSQVVTRCEDSLFRLKIWISEVDLEKMPVRGDDDLDSEAITLTSSILYRLLGRVRNLSRNIDSVARSSSRALSFSFAAPMQSDVNDDSSDSEHPSLPWESLPPAGRVEQHLTQIELQVRTLRRITRSLRIVQKDDFSVAVVKHVAEVNQLFGDGENCDKWREEVQGMPSDAALRTAKELAGMCA